jgi:hypothetical protein
MGFLSVSVGLPAAMAGTGALVILGAVILRTVRRA